MEIHVLGCGNILKGDDGFGPAVAVYLEANYHPKENVKILDAGLACGEWLKPLIYDDLRPQKIIIVDVLDMELIPGEITIFNADKLKLADLSMSSHFFPDKFIIEELMSQGVDITFVSCQQAHIPKDISTDLSKNVLDAVPKVADIVAKMCGLEKLS
ncbi:MAG: hydrogenase maturation protease [Candidatus Kariarchaeaceae archaeon]